MKPAKKPIRNPINEPIMWSDQDLEDMSVITPADIKAAMALWQAEAPATLKDLLKANVQEVNKTND